MYSCTETFIKKNYNVQNDHLRVRNDDENLEQHLQHSQINNASVSLVAYLK
jgi:hypothetical protein